MAKNWKGGGTDTSTQEVTYPQYIEDAQRRYYGAREGWMDEAVRNGGMPLATLSRDQYRAGDMLRGMVAEPSRNWAGDIMAAGAPVTGEEIVDGMNPFLDRVGRDTLAAMGREHGNRAAEIGARAAGRSAYGGSGEAIERAQLNRSHGQQVGETIGSLLSGGYDRSTQLAEGNANRRLSAAVSASGAENDAFNRNQTAAGSLLQYGGLEQNQRQAELDRVRSLLEWYGSGLPGVGSTTTTNTPNQSPGILQQLLGGALTIGGMGMSGGGTLLGNFLGGYR